MRLGDTSSISNSARSVRHDPVAFDRKARRNFLVERRIVVFDRDNEVGHPHVALRPVVDGSLDVQHRLVIGDGPFVLHALENEGLNVTGMPRAR